jgi:hypothetical protein
MELVILLFYMLIGCMMVLLVIGAYLIVTVG